MTHDYNREDMKLCPDCKRPVEYIPEMNGYSCGVCEQVFDERLLIRQSDLEREVKNES